MTVDDNFLSGKRRASLILPLKQKVALVLSEFSSEMLSRPLLPFLYSYMKSGMGKRYRFCNLFLCFSPSDKIADIPDVFAEKSEDPVHECEIMVFFLQWIRYFRVDKLFREAVRPLSRDRRVFDYMLAKAGGLSGEEAARSVGLSLASAEADEMDRVTVFSDKFRRCYLNLPLFILALKGGGERLAGGDLVKFSDQDSVTVFLYALSRSGCQDYGFMRIGDDGTLVFNESRCRKLISNDSEDMPERLSLRKSGARGGGRKSNRGAEPARVPSDPASKSALAELEAILRNARFGMNIESIQEKSLFSRTRIRELLSGAFDILVEGRYYHKDNIRDFGRVSEAFLSVLDELFEINGGYASGLQLYRRICAVVPDFLRENSIFDSVPAVYGIARNLFERNSYKGRSYVFNSKFIWKEEPPYPKNISGLCCHWARRNGNFLTRDEIFDKLDENGFVRGYFSAFMPDQPYLYQYEKYKFVLAESLGIDDAFIGRVREAVSALVGDRDYVLFGDVGDGFYDSLPSLPYGISWSALLLRDFLKTRDVGFKSIPSLQCNDLCHPDSVLMRKDSSLAFSDVVWLEMDGNGDLPGVFPVADFRAYLVSHRIITPEQNITNVSKTVASDPRFRLSDSGDSISVLKE